MLMPEIAETHTADAELRSQSVLSRAAVHDFCGQPAEAPSRRQSMNTSTTPRRNMAATSRCSAQPDHTAA
jgi:hypothetical protein